MFTRHPKMAAERGLMGMWECESPRRIVALIQAADGQVSKTASIQDGSGTRFRNEEAGTSVVQTHPGTRRGGFSDPGGEGQMKPDLVPDEDHVSGDPLFPVFLLNVHVSV